MPDEHTERTSDPVQNDAAAPTPRRLPLAFGITKGGRPKYDEPGTPGSLSRLLALQIATQGTRVHVVDVDAQGTATRPRWVDQ
ncbi:hypothetical protein OG883_44615 [Streptomyces sp. NBC_01142]|uniref:hypothetical protein n=1 Tax=Streptomyces sp. NBC_01142 TaxID=2975865 RepID=UPI0022500F6D|nr:hypothetical protein [Streptomyces sp. NBC_01142]MCX4826729.1 hypothetical protein [Streptomyces sp. NBC_01142]